MPTVSKRRLAARKRAQQKKLKKLLEMQQSTRLLESILPEGQTEHTIKNEPMDSDYPPQLEEPVSLSPTYNLDESTLISGDHELIDFAPAAPPHEAAASEESISPEPEPTLPSGLIMDIKEEPYELSPQFPEAAPDPLQIQSCLFCYRELSNGLGQMLEDSTLCKRIEFVLVAKFNFPEMSYKVPCCTSCVQMFDLFYEFKKNCLAALTKQDELRKANILEPIKQKQTKPPETKQIQVVKTEKLIEKKPGKQHKEVETVELVEVQQLLPEVTVVKVSKQKMLEEPPKAFDGPEKVFKCSVCPAALVNEEELEYHMNEHSGMNPFKCRIIACNQTFPNPKACFKHETICATTSKTCDICSLVFPTASALKVHKNVHTIAQDCENYMARKCANAPRKRFQCPRCEKCFYRRGTLEAHLKRHDGIRPFQCDKPGCGKAYLGQKGWSNHKKVCGTLGLVCDVCGATLLTHDSLKTHREKHEERKMQCNQCEKRFHDKKSLNKHMSVHSNERKFECKVCGKRFKSREANRVHQRIHTKEKPYACPECGQRFTYNCSLKAHLDKKACIVR